MRTLSIAAIVNGAPIVVETPIGQLDIVPESIPVIESDGARPSLGLLDRTWTPIAPLDTLIALKERNSDSRTAILHSYGPLPSHESLND